MSALKRLQQDPFVSADAAFNDSFQNVIKECFVLGACFCLSIYLVLQCHRMIVLLSARRCVCAYTYVLLLYLCLLFVSLMMYLLIFVFFNLPVSCLFASVHF